MLPKVSVVTINYNMRDGLAKTVESVTAQTYPNLEYLVIDGGSTDGSVDIIHAHAGRIHYWVSERDRNLYHAMNKGVAAASGSWVLFMNSGDCFVDPEVVGDVFKTDHEDADLVYGHYIRCYRAEGVSRIIPADSADVLPRRMNCSHQSLFSRRVLLLEHPFREDMIASDYEFLVSAKVEGRRFKLVPRVVAAMDADGLTNRNRLLSLRQRRAIVRQYGLMTPRLAAIYTWYAARATFGLGARHVLPMPVIRWVLRNKRVANGG